MKRKIQADAAGNLAKTSPRFLLAGGPSAIFPMPDFFREERGRTPHEPRTTRPAAGEPEMTCVLGQPFHRMTAEGALDDCDTAINEGAGQHFVTVNMDFISQAQRRPDLRKMLFHADRILCDGQPLVWLSKLLRDPLPERVAGADLVPRLLDRCARNGHSVFFFGSDEATISRLEESLKEQMPDLRIAGAIAPPMGTVDSWDNDQYVDAIREAKPDVLLVALGFPKQDLWIDRFRKLLEVPLSIGIGASLDFIAGKQKRAPRWMQKVGLEWSWRLMTAPRRLAGRYARNFVSLATLTTAHIASLSRRGHSADSGRSLTPIDPILASTLRPRPGDLPEAPSSPGAIICDCSELTSLDQRTLGWLAVTARNCRQRNQALTLFNAPRALNQFIHAFHLEDEMPLFNSPPALLAWLGESASGRAGESRSSNLRAPSCLIGKATRFLIDSVAELDRALPEGTPITIDLGRTARIDSRGGGELTRLKTRFEACGRSLHVAMRPGAVRETLRLLQLQPFLAGSPDLQAETQIPTGFPASIRALHPSPEKHTASLSA